jgi:hypothetical protein
MVKYKIGSARFLVFWDVTLAGQVVQDVSEDHIAFFFWVKPSKNLIALVDPDKEDYSLQHVRYCLPSNTVSHLRRLESFRQSVNMMQVLLEDYRHVGCDTVLVSNLLPVC